MRTQGPGLGQPVSTWSRLWRPLQGPTDVDAHGRAWKPLGPFGAPGCTAGISWGAEGACGGCQGLGCDGDSLRESAQHSLELHKGPLATPGCPAANTVQAL